MSSDSNPFFEDVENSSYQLLVTSPRHEKVMAKALEGAGAAYFLPLERREKKYKSGRSVNEVPLFSTYVFLKNGVQHKEYLFTFNRHMNSVIDIPDASRDSLLEELKNLDTLLKSQAPVRACDTLSEGDRVVIKAGPLKGVEGVIIESRASLRFVVNIEFLGRSVETELDPADLKLA